MLVAFVSKKNSDCFYIFKQQAFDYLFKEHFFDHFE